MCGFLFSNRKIHDLDDCITYLINRGPDHTSSITFRDFNCVHSLLSITGAKRPQPFFSKLNSYNAAHKAINNNQYQDDDILCMYNGEIYNADQFGKFNSDGECLIPLYQEYGVNFIQKLEGEYALLLYDRKNNLLIISTDIFGTKPLWIAIEGSNIGVSSYASCLMHLGFSQPQEVSANSTLILDGSSFEIIEKRIVHQFNLKQHKRQYEDWEQAFENAVKTRTLHSREKAFIGLSSGYDSGVIGLALHKQGIPFKAYSIIGSENPETIKDRMSFLNCEQEILSLDRDRFLKAREYLKQNCEPYDLMIDNDEKNNYEKAQSALDKENRRIFFAKKNIPALEKEKDRWQRALESRKAAQLTDDNGSIGLSAICQLAREDNRLIYFSGQGADEIISDYGFGGIKHYRHSTFGGHFPKNLRKHFPWRNFFGNTQRAYLRKEEHVSGSYGIEGRYPFLDKKVVQEFLSLDQKFKNAQYKAPLHAYLCKNNFPFDVNKKVGFNCGFSGASKDYEKRIATRKKVGESTDPSLRVNLKKL